MEELVVILIRGIGLGALYALVAMSLNVIFNTSQILNFAQGFWLVIGGVFAFLWYRPTGGGLLLWIALAVVASLVVSLMMTVQGAITVLPLRSSVEQHTWVVTTLAASVIIGSALLILLGPNVLAVSDPLGLMQIAGTKVPTVYPFLAILAVAVWGLLRIFERKTLTGVALNAMAQDLEAARAAGVSVKRFQILSFAIAGLILGLTGFVSAQVISIGGSSAILYVIAGFVVGVVGGLGNNLGALIAGPVYGVLEMYVTYQFGGSLTATLTLLVLVGVLMFRQEGILGRPKARRV